MSVDDLADRIQSLVHRDTQVHDDGVDLTVAAVYAITGPGEIDFGGGELVDSNTSKIEPLKRAASDDYGWWHLGGGVYHIEFNESLTSEDALVLQPRRELVERGASHPTLHVTDLSRIPLTVPPAGLQLKENARVSTLVASDSFD
jgi:hypothetical protein